MVITVYVVYSISIAVPKRLLDPVIFSAFYYINQEKKSFLSKKNSVLKRLNVIYVINLF